MNGLQIETLLMNNTTTKPYYKSCFNNNFIPKNFNFNKYFIVINTQTDVNLMGHWTLFYVLNNGTTLLWFDSFGKHPSFYGGAIERFFIN